MLPTPLRYVNPATVPRDLADCAPPHLDTSLHQTMTGATTTDPHHGMHLHTMGAPHRGMDHHGPLGTSPHGHPSMDHQDPLSEVAGVVLHLGTVWSVMDLSMSVNTSMSGTMSPPPMIKASPMAIHTNMGEIHTRAHRGLPTMGHLHPLTHIRVGCPMATALPHLLHTDGGHLGHCPTLITTPQILEGPTRACMNLIVRQMKMTGASNH